MGMSCSILKTSEADDERTEGSTEHLRQRSNDHHKDLDNFFSEVSIERQNQVDFFVFSVFFLSVLFSAAKILGRLDHLP